MWSDSGEHFRTEFTGTPRELLFPVRATKKKSLPKKKKKSLIFTFFFKKIQSIENVLLKSIDTIHSRRREKEQKCLLTSTRWAHVGRNCLSFCHFILAGCVSGPSLGEVWRGGEGTFAGTQETKCSVTWGELGDWTQCRH